MKQTAPGFFEGTFAPLKAIKELNIVFVTNADSLAITSAYADKLRLPKYVLPHKAMSTLRMADLLQLVSDIFRLRAKTTSFTVQLDEFNLIEIQAVVEYVAKSQNKRVNWKTLDLPTYRENRFNKNYNYKF